MKGFLATRLKCFITQNVLLLDVSSHRAVIHVIADYKEARAKMRTY